MKTSELLGALERHLIKRKDFPGGVFIPEVGLNGQRDAPGSNRLDAAHVGFTGSSGQMLRGYELKVSRSDWLHELKQPDKAAMWESGVHEFWLVSLLDVANSDEVPHGWGWLVAGAKGLTVVQRPVRKPEGWSPPWWAVRSIMARQDTLLTGAVGRARQEEKTKCAEDREVLVQREVLAAQARAEGRGSLADEITALRLELTQMRDATGLQVNGTGFLYRPDLGSRQDNGTSAVTPEELLAFKEVLRGSLAVQDAVAALRRATTYRYGELHELKGAVSSLERLVKRFGDGA